MSKIHSHISSALKVLEKYDGSIPLAQYLKKFFSSEKKYGSKDRKSIAGLCYAYFRTGFLMRNGNRVEKILAGLFLTENTYNEFLEVMQPEWNDKIGLSNSEKLVLLGIRYESMFPFLNELTEEIDKESFVLSLFIQPGLFIRARRGKLAAVLQQLRNSGISFETHGDDCLSLPHSTKTGNILKINSDVVIQDMNSQKVLDFLSSCNPQPENDKKTNTWDCCAASGGKSILIYDRLNGNVRLTVSDIRDSILVKLRKRMVEAGIHINKYFITDLSQAIIEMPGKFDIILCDAPCSGSGTWSRTPEQLHFFQSKKIGEYAALQEKIISNTIPSLAEGGLYFYISCSVFQQENEAQVKFIQEKFNLELQHMEYLKGYDKYADTMFVSVFKK